MIFSILNLKKFGLDFYVSSQELTINGITEKSKKQIEDLSKNFEEEVMDVTKTGIRKRSVKEKNYGRGADWTVALVEFVAHSDLLRAIATTGGLITFSKYVVTITKKLLERKNPGIFLGMKTAKFFAIKYIGDKVAIENLKLVKSYEVNKGEMGFTEKEYLFIFSVNRTKRHDIQDRFNKEKKYSEEIFIVNIDWRGNLKSINRF